MRMEALCRAILFTIGPIAGSGVRFNGACTWFGHTNAATMIDLSSDTATRPTPGMRDAMAHAQVGDEQRGEDPTTNALQERVAQLLDKEASLFVPSATMANAIACRLHTRPGDAVILDSSAHILTSETGGLAVHSGLIPSTVIGDRGRFTPEQVLDLVRPPSRYEPQPTLVTCEQTHNRGGGSVWTLRQLQAVCHIAREHRLRTHLDGSRLLNAVVATGVSAAAFSTPFDTVTLCLTKGLGCPVGALLAGSADCVVRARTLKQQFGGAMRQSGILAAAGLYALDNHVTRLVEDHAHARQLADALVAIPSLVVEQPVETNMVYLDIRETGLTAGEALRRLEECGVRASARPPHRLRFVTHRDVTSEDIGRAAGMVRAALADPSGTSHGSTASTTGRHTIVEPNHARSK
jgi:threonine aldolase